MHAPSEIAIPKPVTRQVRSFPMWTRSDPKPRIPQMSILGQRLDVLGQ